MKILLLVISLSFLLLSQATFAYTLTNIDTKFANKVKILNERIKKWASYETIYKQQLLFQKNIKKNRDSKNVKSVTYKNLDKNYAISQYILDNLINYWAVNQNIVTTIPIKTQEQIVVKKQTCDDWWYYNEWAMSCQPNNPTRTCSISNGIGKQTWNGNNWESCIVASCISWYSVSNWNCSVNQSIQQQTTTTNYNNKSVNLFFWSTYRKQYLYFKYKVLWYF